MGSATLALLVMLLAQLPDFLASQGSQRLVYPNQGVSNVARGSPKENVWGDMAALMAGDPSSHARDFGTRFSGSSAGFHKPSSTYNATQPRTVRTRRLLAAADTSEPAICPLALVTAYARMHYDGPMVSFNCSSNDLSLMLCFPPASMVIAPGVTVALFTHVGFTGDMLVLRSSEPRLYFNHPRKFSFAASMAICDADVDDPITDCPEGGAASLRICPEENPLGQWVDPYTATTAHSDGEHYRTSTDRRFVLKYARPRQVFWQTSGPEPCFYKTYIREAQMGCLPLADKPFQDLAQEFIPRYHGVVHNFVYGAGEWIVMENVAHGLSQPSVLTLDPSSGKCSRCGIDIRRYKTYLPLTLDYKVVTHDDIQRRHASTSNKKKLVLHEVAEFFFDGTARIDVVTQLLPRIDRLHQLLKANKLVAFPDATIIMLYSQIVGDPSLDGIERWPYESRLHLVDFGGVLHMDYNKALSILPPIFKLKGGLEPNQTTVTVSEEVHARGVNLPCGVLEISIQLQGFAAEGKMKADKCLAPCHKCR
eukprot:jgi/Mesvir1/21237/Mv06670-RA.1